MWQPFFGILSGMLEHSILVTYVAVLEFSSMMRVFCNFHCCKNQNIVKDIIYHLNIYFRVEVANYGISGGIDGLGTQEVQNVDN